MRSVQGGSRDTDSGRLTVSMPPGIGDAFTFAHCDYNTRDELLEHRAQGQAGAW